MPLPEPESAPASPHPGTTREVFAAFLKLGCTAFGGPIAHLGYFQNEFVTRRRWIDDHTYADFVALCQFLPGPTSSQVGLALGWKRAGWRGALAAWFAFTMPSAALMFAFACGIRHLGDLAHAGWVTGLKIAAAAVVFQAVRSMAVKLCPDAPRAVLAATATAALLLWPAPWMQIAVLALGALLGLFLRSPTTTLPPQSAQSTKTLSSSSVPSFPSAPSVPSSPSLSFLLTFFALLLLLPWLAHLWPAPALQVFSRFYRTGSLVFGGGHVVLPLLEQATVAPGWLDKSTFLAGYGAAQALPGPLFTFSVYLGALIPPGGLFGALLALIAIYLPTVFLVFGTLPHWERLRAAPSARALLAGANAAVVGLLAAAFYSPIWTSTITGPGRFLFALAAYLSLEFLRFPPWLVVLACAFTGNFLLS
jgi:chromate transporter